MGKQKNALGQFVKGNKHAFKPGAANPKSKVREPDSALTQSDLLTRLAGQGIRDDDLRRVCGIPSSDWPEHKRQHPEIQESIDKGRAKMHDSLVAVLYKNAMKGQLVPALFLLKTQFQYRENDPVDNEGGVRINISIPGAEHPSTMIEGTRLDTSEIDQARGTLSMDHAPAPEPEPTYTTTPSDEAPARTEPTNGTRSRALDAFEAEIGISSSPSRSNFSSDAAYNRFIRRR